MRYLLLLTIMLTACEPGEHQVLTPRYWSCDESSICLADTECTMLQEETSYCTTECVTHTDCTDSGWPSVCVYDDSTAETAHCYGECWPTHPGEEEDLEFCRKYGFLCPSDCELQGLVCDYVGGWPPRYSCIPSRE